MNTPNTSASPGNFYPELDDPEAPPPAPPKPKKKPPSRYRIVKGYFAKSYPNALVAVTRTWLGWLPLNPNGEAKSWWMRSVFGYSSISDFIAYDEKNARDRIERHRTRVEHRPQVVHEE